MNSVDFDPPTTKETRRQKRGNFGFTRALHQRGHILQRAKFGPLHNRQSSSEDATLHFGTQRGHHANRGYWRQILHHSERHD